MHYDTNAAINFLKSWLPEGPWLLSAKLPDGGFTTKRFGPDTEAACRNWVEARQPTHNIYFAVNETSSDDKAKKEDVTRVVTLHVDVDPAPAEERDGLLNEERERIKRLLEGFEPRASVIVDSGGGFQAFWRLEQPVVISGNAETTADIEARNIRLANALGGDRCHDISRIMRLPGTVNRPDEKKRRKGRVEAATAIVRNEPTTLHPLGNFPPAVIESAAPPRPNQPKAQPCAAVARPAGPLPRIAADDLDLGRLSEGARERLVAVVHHGATEEYGFGEDRSRACWYVACELARAGVPPEQAVAILVNPDNGISAHILEKGGRDPVKYAADRFVSKAMEQVRPNIIWPRTSPKDPSQPIKCYVNIAAALQYIGVAASFDEFQQQHRYSLDGGQSWRPLTDRFIAEIRAEMIAQPAINMAFTLPMVREAVEEVSFKNAADPVLDYLADVQTKWDGVPRLDTWLTDYMGAEDTELHRFCGTIILIAAVRRARQPGAKFDHVLVLEGPQDKGKSSAIRVLAEAAGDGLFNDTSILNKKDQERAEQLQGVWLYEMAELTGLSKADLNDCKNFITKTEERGRKAWGHYVERQRRRCVFFATTNDQQYLRDPTGNRRWLPVRVGETLRVADLERDRDQLWAEAAHREAAGEKIWFDDERLKAELAQAQATRVVDDPWDDLLAGLPTVAAVHQGQRHEAVLTKVALEKLGHAAQSAPHVMTRLKRVMERLGFPQNKKLWVPEYKEQFGCFFRERPMTSAGGQDNIPF
jgi:hypothetical protein